MAIEDLAREISRCRVCRDGPSARPLPHEPRPIFRLSTTARLFVCSQAPGARAHASGIPFSDPSGVRLRHWMGLTDKEFYDEAKVAIVPMGFCFPGNDSNGGDLPPRSECAPLWRERIFRSLPQSPELILLVGSYAQRWHLGTSSKPSLTETLRAWRTYAEARNKPLHFPLPHPSWRNSGWLKKNPWFEAETVPALRVAVQKAIS